MQRAWGAPGWGRVRTRARTPSEHKELSNGNKAMLHWRSCDTPAVAVPCALLNCALQPDPGASTGVYRPWHCIETSCICCKRRTSSKTVTGPIHLTETGLRRLGSGRLERGHAAACAYHPPVSAGALLHSQHGKARTDVGRQRLCRLHAAAQLGRHLHAQRAGRDQGLGHGPARYSDSKLIICENRIM